MSFRNLILYNVIKYLTTGNELYVKTFVSLCYSFNVDKVKILNKFYNSKNTKLITNALKYTKSLKEIILEYPEDIIKDLLILKLDKFNKTIKRNYRLPANGVGIVIINGNSIFYNADNDTLLFIRIKYSPSTYFYKKLENEAHRSTVCKNSTVLLFGYEEIDYFTYINSKKILCNKDIKVKVLNECILSLLKDVNALDTIFSNKTTGIISCTLNDIYFSVKESVCEEDFMSKSN